MKATTVPGSTGDAKACLQPVKALEPFPPTARDEMIEKHLGLVHHVAHQLLQKSPSGAELDEFISAGSIGLMQAVDRFEPERGLSFSTFAAPRIRGAILDDLRTRDHVPRTRRRRSRDLADTREGFVRELGRQPTDVEMAEGLGVGIQKLQQWVGENENLDLMSLDRPMGNGDGKIFRVDIIPGADGRRTLEDLAYKEAMHEVTKAILALPKQQREVMHLYYFDQLKLRQIAGIMGVTESRISQVKQKAVHNVRLQLEEDEMRDTSEKREAAAYIREVLTVDSKLQTKQLQILVGQEMVLTASEDLFKSWATGIRKNMGIARPRRKSDPANKTRSAAGDESNVVKEDGGNGVTEDADVIDGTKISSINEGVGPITAGLLDLESARVVEVGNVSFMATPLTGGQWRVDLSITVSDEDEMEGLAAIAMMTALTECGALVKEGLSQGDI